jgi:hypothetical protein
MSDPQSGLCPTCLHARAVASARGSRFLMCARAKDDPCFAKYPRLPVVQCAGYEPQPERPAAGPPTPLTT